MITEWVGVLLPVAALSGWLAGSKSNMRQRGESSERLRVDYFKGLNFLINEQPDKAVDVFIQLLEVDSETVETHLALGNLFRRRGEVDRAIRVHQNIIARPELSKLHRDSALQALGQDYLAAGVLDRAERVFLDLVKYGNENMLVLSSLMRIYQQEKDWRKAIQIARRLALSGVSPMAVDIAQFYCELAESEMLNQQYAAAQKYIKQALSTNKRCIRASLLQAEMAYGEARYKEAVRLIESLSDVRLAYRVSCLRLLSSSYARLAQHGQFVDFLVACLHRHPELLSKLPEVISEADWDDYQPLIDVIEIDVKDRGDGSPAGFLALLRQQRRGASEETLACLSLLLTHYHGVMAQLLQYQCEYCGFSSQTLFWSCPGCHKWETMALRSVDIN